MTDLDFESDQLLVELTDALHAGPGSPAWHEVVNRLSTSGLQSKNETELLLRVREHLERGQSFRTIRAGTEFTRTLMRSLDVEPAVSASSRNWFVLASCMGVVLLALAAIAIMIFRSNGTGGSDGANGVLLNTVDSVDFENGVPADWQAIGGLGLTTSRNMLLPDLTKPTAATGGGIAWNRPIPASEPFSFSANYRLPRADSEWAAELFISDSPVFDSSNGTTAHEFVWLCQGRNTSIISPSGKVLVQQQAVGDARNILQLRLTINDSLITVEQSGKRLWSGPHELETAKPRTVGLRFLHAGATTTSEAGFSRVRVNMRASTP